MAPANNTFIPKRWLVLAVIALALLVAYQMIASISIRNTTGELVVKTSTSGSIITISAANSAAAVLGSGSANVRIKPGHYLVVATSSGKVASAVVDVKLRNTTKSSLTLSAPNAIPSVDAITFNGTEALITNGLTTRQVTNLKKLFFAYNKSAKTVTINSSSVTPGPHDPQSNDPTFNLTFTGTVDTTDYNATITYRDLQNVQLTLTDPSSNAVLYQGDSTPSDT